MKLRLKELTGRSNGIGYERRKQKLKEYVRGWIGYYHLANMKRLLLETDGWLQRRIIRVCILKFWKKPKTRISNLIRCGIPKRKARECGYTRLGYWRIANSWIIHSSMTNEQLRIAGYPTLYNEYLKGILNKEPPRAESHAWWCERSENESRKKTTSFSSYSIKLIY